MKMLSYFSSVAYRTVYVYDPVYSAELERPRGVNDTPEGQGFFGFPGLFVFDIITDNEPIHIDVFIDEPIQLSENTIRMIQLPFKVIGDEGIVVEPVMSDKRSIAVSKGEYALVFEQRYMDIWTEADMELDSTEPLLLQYKHTWDLGKERTEFLEEGGKIDEFYRMAMVMSRIWLNPATNVEAKILVQDTVANSNYPLSPTYPLVFDPFPEYQ